MFKAIRHQVEVILFSAVFILFFNIGCTLTASVIDLKSKATGNEPTTPAIPVLPVGSAPTAIVSSASASTTVFPIQFDILFSESVSSLSELDFDLINCEIVNLSGSGNTFSLLVNPLGSGLVTVSLKIGAVFDIDGNTNTQLFSNSIAYSLPVAQITLIKDINPTEQGSDPELANAVKLGSNIYFTASNGVHGNELWKSDGTANGTVLVKDIVPGMGSSYPSHLIVFGSKVFFFATSSDGILDIYSTDGSTEGTDSLARIPNYTFYENNGIFNYSFGNGFCVLNGFLFFSVKDSSSTAFLARTDGSDAGTIILSTDISGVYPEAIVGNRLLFRGETSAEGSELFYTEGTQATTQILKDINVGPSLGYWTNDSYFSNGILLFKANNGTGTKMWRTDGTTAGTVIYDTVSYSPIGTENGFLANYLGNLYFLDGVAPKVNLGAHPMVGKPFFINSRWVVFSAFGSNLSFSSTNGVSILEHQDLDLTTTSWSYRSMVATSFGAFFPVKSVGTGWELAFHNAGAASPAVLLGDQNPGLADFITSYDGVSGVELSGQFIFSAATASSGEELWISDGTLLGTRLLKDIFPGIGSSNPEAFFYDSGFVYFRATNGVNGSELFRTDGSEVGTVMVKNLNLLKAGSSIEEITVIGGNIYFSAFHPLYGQELWKSDGTSGGTQIVSDGIAGSFSSWPYELRNLNGNLVYLADETIEYTTTPWISDGTAGGTHPIRAGFWDSSWGYTGGLTVLSSKAYFQGYESLVGRELFVTDGTDPGTMNVADLRPGASSFFDYGSGDPELFANTTQDLLYFVKEMGNYGPWVSDGTAGGAIELNANISSAGGFYAIDGTTYFSADDDLTGETELFVSDGTSGGTSVVKDLEIGASSYALPKGRVTNQLLFTAWTTATGQELWITDGTDPGTTLLKEFTVGPSDTFFGNFSQERFADGKTIFGVDVIGQGMELWITDGTTLGTQLLKDIFPGTTGSYPSDFVKVGSYIYFAATSDTGGRELWRTDGTALGTTQVLDLIAGPESSSPGLMTVWGVKIIFIAFDLLGDQELHVVDTSTL